MESSFGVTNTCSSKEGTSINVRSPFFFISIEDAICFLYYEFGELLVYLFIG